LLLNFANKSQVNLVRIFSKNLLGESLGQKKIVIIVKMIFEEAFDDIDSVNSIGAIPESPKVHFF
jgi:ribosomal protein L7Ae-like RNA K-turn-binding protein